MVRNDFDKSDDRSYFRFLGLDDSIEYQKSQLICNHFILNLELEKRKEGKYLFSVILYVVLSGKEKQRKIQEKVIESCFASLFFPCAFHLFLVIIAICRAPCKKKYIWVHFEFHKNLEKYP